MAVGFAIIHCGSASPVNREKPIMKRFLPEFISTCCKLDIPTATIIPTCNKISNFDDDSLQCFGQIRKGTKNIQNRNSMEMWTNRYIVFPHQITILELIMICIHESSKISYCLNSPPMFPLSCVCVRTAHTSREMSAHKKLGARHKCYLQKCFAHYFIHVIPNSDEFR